MSDANKNTDYFLKDRAWGGHLPGDVEDLSKAVEARRRINEKAAEGKVTLKHGDPTIVGGDAVIIKGVGDRFSGKWTVEKHTLKLSAGAGLTSELQVSRNALGDSSPDGDGTDGTGGGKTSGSVPTGSDDTITPPAIEEDLLDQTQFEGLD